MKSIMGEILDMRMEFETKAGYRPNRLEIPNHRMPEFSQALSLETKDKVIVNPGKKSGYSSLVYRGMKVQIAMNKDA